MRHGVMILLLHTCSNREKRFGSLIRAAGMTAPTGLACLQWRWPDRVLLRDLQDRLPTPADLAVPDSGAVRSVLVQAASDWDQARSVAFQTRLRGCFPQATLVLGGFLPAGNLHGWDTVLRATGMDELAQRLGESPQNLWKSPVWAEPTTPSPAEHMLEALLYQAAVEKSAAECTIALYRPWQGLLDRCLQIGLPPPEEFWLGLGRRLQRCGFAAVSLETEIPHPEALRCFLQAMQKSGLRVGVSLSQNNRACEDHLENLFRVWLVPTARNGYGKDLLETARRLHRDGVPLGLKLEAKCAGLDEWRPLQSFVDDLSLVNVPGWSTFWRKRTLLDFYVRQLGIGRKIFAIQTAADLIRTMRGAYGIFDLMFYGNPAPKEGKR